MDISNGEGVGVSLFVQGCPFHCKNCFNENIWDYNKGKIWDKDTKKIFLNLVNQPQIVRISLLGGEPLYSLNLDGILDLCKTIKIQYPNKIIWLYSGYKFDDIFANKSIDMLKRQSIIKLCNVMVDGQFIDSLKDMNLKFKGSSNQRVIDIQNTLKWNKIIIYKDY